MLPGSAFPQFWNLGTLHTGVFICSFLGGSPGFRTVQAHSSCSVNVCCPSTSKGRCCEDDIIPPGSEGHHHHCLCPLSRWDKGQQKGENRTWRARSWARKGHSELPGLGASSMPLPSLPPPGLTSPCLLGQLASCPRAFARAVSSAGDAFLPFSPESLLPNFPHGLHHHLLREAILISLACPAPVPSVRLWFYTGLGPLILVCLPA